MKRSLRVLSLSLVLAAQLPLAFAAPQDTAANPTVTWSLSPSAPWSLVAAVLTPSPIKRKTQSIVGD